MKIAATLEQVGPVLRALHDAGVAAAIVERTGPGWIVELMRPPTAGDLVSAVKATGAQVLP